MHEPAGRSNVLANGGPALAVDEVRRLRPVRST